MAPKDVDIGVGQALSLSLHNALLCSDVSNGFTVFRKAFLDLSRHVGGTWPNSGCRASDICRILSLLLVALRLISGGAIPARIYRFSVGVGLRQPEIKRHVAFKDEFIFST